MPKSPHQPTYHSDGRVSCTCGATSHRYGSHTRAKSWIVNHRREEKEKS